MANFIESLYQQYVDLYFTYLEINPLVITGGKVYVLDLAAKLDATADFICRAKWGEIEYPPPFGRDAFPEEAYIADLDSKSGASLKVRMRGCFLSQNLFLFSAAADNPERKWPHLDDGCWRWRLCHLFRHDL